MPQITFTKNTIEKYESLYRKLQLFLPADPRAQWPNAAEVQAYITELNQAHISSREAPYLIWLLNEFINKGYSTSDSLKLDFYYKHGLIFDLKTTLLGCEVSVLTYLSQFEQLNLVQYFVEVVKIKINNNEPIHPIGLSQIAASKTSGTAAGATNEYLMNNLLAYSNAQYSHLTMAVRYGYEKLLDLWTSAATIDQLDGMDLTPLMHAVIHGRTKIIDYLLARNANPLIKNGSKQTVFHVLFTNPDQKCVASLINKYSFLQENIYTNLEEAKDMDGLLPIHYAVLFNHIDWLKNTWNTHPNLMNYIDGLGRSLISFCPQDRHLPLLEWLSTRLASSTRNSPALEYLIGGASEYKSPRIIKWSLSQNKLNLNARYSVAGRSNGLNIAQLLCAIQQIDSIVDLDLYRKNEDLLFDKDNLGRASVDHFFLDPKQQNSNECYLASGLKLMRYVLSIILEPSGQRSLSVFKQFKEILMFCLNHGLLQINDNLENGVPIFHCIESYFYSQYKKFSSFKLFEALLNINSEEQAREWLLYYQHHIQFFIQTYKPELNLLDEQGFHLFAKLARLGPDGLSRIQWLFANVKGFSLDNVSSNRSSLLHIACEEQYFDMVRWCCEKNRLPILRQRADGMSALDLALLSKNNVISKYLISKLSNKKWINYINTLTRTHKNSLLEHLEAHTFYGRPITVSTPNNLFEKTEHQHSRIIDDKCTVDAESNDQVITYEVFITAIKCHQLKVIKKFKEKYSHDHLSALIAVNSEDVLAKILMATYSVMYQLLRISAVKDLVDKNIQSILKKFIEESNVQILLLLLNQPSTKESLLAYGLEWLLDASKLEKPEILLLLLNEPLIISNAHENENQLLRHAAKKGWMQIVSRLCEAPNVAATADVFENEALKSAIQIHDFDSCAILLEFACVQNTLNINDYAFIEELIKNEENDVLDMLLQFPEIRDYIGRSHPDRVSIEHQETSSLPDATGQGFVESSSATAILPNHAVQEESYANMSSGYQPYFFNLNYYITPFHEYSFFNAIISNDLGQLEQLFFSNAAIHPDLIHRIILFAVRYGQIMVFNYLLEWTRPILAFNAFLGNQLVCETVRMKKDDFFEQLLSFEFISNNIDKYNNRLLRCAVRYGSDHQVMRLLTYQKVRNNLTAVNNYTLRWSSTLGRIALVQALLQYESVCSSVAAFNFYALRKALVLGHHEIVILLLDVPHVLDYATKQVGIFDAYILQFATQEITRCIQDSAPLSGPQLARLNLFQKYPTTRDDEGYKKLLASFSIFPLSKNTPVVCSEHLACTQGVATKEESRATEASFCG